MGNCYSAFHAFLRIIVCYAIVLLELYNVCYQKISNFLSKWNIKLNSFNTIAKYSTITNFISGTCILNFSRPVSVEIIPTETSGTNFWIAQIMKWSKFLVTEKHFTTTQKCLHTYANCKQTALMENSIFSLTLFSLHFFRCFIEKLNIHRFAYLVWPILRWA